MLDYQTVGERASSLNKLELDCAGGDGDSVDFPRQAEDALLFDVLVAIALGADDPKGLAAHTIQACAAAMNGRCCAFMSSPVTPEH